MRARQLAAGASIVLATALLPALAQTKDPALDKLAADWAAAFAKGDAKALAGFYTENAIRVSAEGGTLVGRSAIEKEFTSNFSGAWKGAKISIVVGKTAEVGTGIAVNEGTYEVTGVTGPDGKPVPPIKGSYVNTIVKKDGAWMLASNAAVPPPPPPSR